MQIEKLNKTELLELFNIEVKSENGIVLRTGNKIKKNINVLINRQLDKHEETKINDKLEQREKADKLKIIVKKGKSLRTIIEAINDKTNYIFIYCNVPVIGIEENKIIFQDITNLLQQNKAPKTEIILYFDANVVHYSLSLLQTIFAFIYNKNKQNTFLFKFVGEFIDSTYKMAQTLIPIYLTDNLTKKFFIYTIEYNGNKIEKWEPDPVVGNKLSLIKYVISDDFFPVIPIGINETNNFNYFFDKSILQLLNNREKDIKKIEIKKKANNKEEERKLFNENLESFLKSNINYNDSKFKDIYFLFFYFNIWKKLKLFSNYLYSFNNIEINYIKEKLEIFQVKLEKQPIFKILVFQLILNGEDLFEDIPKKDISKVYKVEQKDKKKITANDKNERKKIKEKRDVFFERLDNIFTVTENIYHGIYELAKNIKKHTHDKFGFITFRIYRNEVIKQLYNSNEKINNHFGNYLKSFEENKTEFLEIFIGDNGSEGILKTGLNNLKNIKSKFDVNENLRSESKNINNQITSIENQITNFEYKNKGSIGKTVFDSFFSIKSLKHGRQSIKSAAGFGLMVFMNRIKRLNGSFTLSTSYNNNTYGFINYFYPERDKNVETIKPFEDIFYHGTNYSIIIPTKFMDKFSSNKKETHSNKFSFENIYSGSNIVYEHLLDFPDTEKEDFSLDKLKNDIENKDNILLDYYLKNDTLENYTEFKGKDKKIIAFDLSDYTGDASDLLRFLATLQFNIQGINAVVLYNDKMERASKFIQILNIYAENEQDFWSDNNAVVFYYKYNGSNYKYKDLLFSFLLLGKEKKDFYKYNNTLRGPHFIKIPENDYIEKESDKKHFDRRIPLFVGDENNLSQMLYLHLVLNKKTNETIFEHNVSVLLNKNIEEK